MVFQRFSHVLLVLGTIILTVRAIDYCDDKATGCNKYKHIGCNNNGAFAAECTRDARIVPMTQGLRDMITNKHNELRNQFAAGVDDFRPASRMSVVLWDNELAKLAELNVKKCAITVDACRNSALFKYVGQNSAISDWSGTDYSPEFVAESHIKLWYDGKRYAEMKHLNSYPLNWDGTSPFGLFTVLVNDRSKFVGCAIMRQTNADGTTRQITTCNYSYDNIVDRPTYIYGKVAYRCQNGTDPVFTSLCSNKEAIPYQNLKNKLKSMQ